MLLATATVHTTTKKFEAWRFFVILNLAGVNRTAVHCITNANMEYH